MSDPYVFESCFAPYISALLQEKRRAGYQYNSEEYHLYRFDRFCLDRGINFPSITRELADEWGKLRETEGPVYQTRRISVIRQLSLYLQASGIESYIPRHFNHKSGFVAYVLSDPEITAFFASVDSDVSDTNRTGTNVRLSIEYKVLFRMILCCGMRVSEARLLTWDLLDLEQGIIELHHSKGSNDRTAYISEDLRELCLEYRNILQDVFNTRSEWVFPAQNPQKSLQVASIGQKFRRCWNATSFARDNGRHPTVHSLRHTFVVKRMNMWMEEGVSLESMMPYLSRFLGHSSVDDTFYYYHLVDSAFKIIHDKDAAQATVIPEVTAYEK